MPDAGCWNIKLRQFGEFLNAVRRHARDDRWCRHRAVRPFDRVLSGDDTVNLQTGRVERHPLVPWWAYALAIAPTLVWACFLAWHDMRGERDDLRTLTDRELEEMSAKVADVKAQRDKAEHHAVEERFRNVVNHELRAIERVTDRFLAAGIEPFELSSSVMNRSSISNQLRDGLDQLAAVVSRELNVAGWPELADTLKLTDEDDLTTQEGFRTAFYKRRDRITKLVSNRL